MVTILVHLGILGRETGPDQRLAGLSEKQPETDADIITRSTVLDGAALARTKGAKDEKSKVKKYSLDLPAHMAECDANYLRLMKLFPAMQTEDAARFSLRIGTNASAVALEVLDRGPYTTLVSLRQEPRRAWGGVPSIQIRVYHDAKSAEVAEIENQGRFYGVYEYPNQRMRQRDEKAQVNRFLGEMLALCLAHGVSGESVDLKP